MRRLKYGFLLLWERRTERSPYCSNQNPATRFPPHIFDLSLCQKFSGFFYMRRKAMAGLNHTIHGHFLARYGLFFDLPGRRVQEHQTLSEFAERILQAVELMLVEKYNVCLSKALRDHLSSYGTDEIMKFWTWFEQVWKDAGKAVGDHENMTPLMGDFPNHIPDDMDVLWIKRFLTLFQPMQDDCLICGKKDTVVELEPCHHRVCMHCFKNYTGCPICGKPIDMHSAFLKNLQTIQELDRSAWPNAIYLDLGQDIDAFAREKFNKMCLVSQALSPQDMETLDVILQGYGDRLQSWLPQTFESRQMQAVVLNKLMQALPENVCLNVLKRYLKNATDVLRLIAVMSGENGTLMPHTVHRTAHYKKEASILDKLSFAQYLSSSVKKFIEEHPAVETVHYVQKSYQIKVTKMSRRQRRMFLELLESFDQNRLCEDFLRHRALWVRVGEFLHPGDYEKRFPKVIKAFDVIRKGMFKYSEEEYKKYPFLSRPQKCRTWRSRLESAISSKNTEELLNLMKQRPGEFARHIDRILRGFGQDSDFSEFASNRIQSLKNDISAKNGKDLLSRFVQLTRGVVTAFTEAANDLNSKIQYTNLFNECIPKLSTPMLVQLWGHFGSRKNKLKKRIFYPAGCSRKIYWSDDRRPVISSIYTKPIRNEILAELLKRFEKKPHFEQTIVDDGLKTLTFPFNERSSGSEAIHVSAGSVLAMPQDNNQLRLFLHWCQKPKSTCVDLDLSVAFLDEDWKLRNYCTYYQLQCASSIDKSKYFAMHSGDFRAAPPPRGATEYVDLDRDLALADGIRYAVMLVQVYAGIDFASLERAYAGVMYRNDTKKKAVFDPQTVRFKYALTGEAKSYIPIVFDLKTGSIHDIQCYTTSGQGNSNLHNNRKTVRDIARYSIEYFSDNPRTMRYDIALMHAASRSDCVWIRQKDNTFLQMVRNENESNVSFYHRLSKSSDFSLVVSGAHVCFELPEIETPSLAFLMDGNISLKDESEYYIIFGGMLTEKNSWIDLMS